MTEHLTITEADLKKLAKNAKPEYVAALLGSDERVEYTVVGDTVNLSQRLQDLARPAGTTVISEATFDQLADVPDVEPLGDQHVKGRDTPIRAFRVQHGGSRS